MNQYANTFEQFISPQEYQPASTELNCFWTLEPRQGARSFIEMRIDEIHVPADNDYFEVIMVIKYCNVTTHVHCARP